MAQMGIPMSNKVGYSMFWNSMWDNKSNYTRTLKEDIYLNKIVPLFFDDKMSANLLTMKTKNKNIGDIKKIKKYYLHSKTFNNCYELKKYLHKMNKLQIYPSKLWILKYQKWLIIYHFLYINYFNNYNTKKIILNNTEYESNYFDVHSNFYKFNLKLRYSYKFLKKKSNLFYF